MVKIDRNKICVGITRICDAFRRFSGKSSINDSLKLQTKSVGFYPNLSIYNSSVRKKCKLITKENGIISWYCCGPTVYDSAHIGHACCYINFDIIRRIIEDIFFQNVIFVMGVTDIDDKIIKRANEERVDFKTISQFYEKEFFRDMSRLNVRKPTITAKVSDNIPIIINFVKKILDNGYGYVTADGSVNFSVNKFKRYGIFVGSQEEVGVQTSDKASSRDFALWKGIKPGEPSWASPWGQGRPGWHIECSAIASKLLGDRLDIHSGGIDLKFPHHENEEAQCCVYHNTSSWVTCWIHSGHVHLKDSVKMSKSLKNTISIDDFLSKYASDHLRMLCLMIPYRNGIEFSDSVMENAVNVYNKCRNFINDCDAYINGTKSFGFFDESILFQDLYNVRVTVMNNLTDDFDTSSAINQILQFIIRTNAVLNQNQQVSDCGSCLAIAAAKSYVQNFLLLCGFTLSDSVDLSNDISNNQANFINVLETSLEFRSKVREIALFKGPKIPELLHVKQTLLSASDEFRKNLNFSGIELKDYGNKTSWNTTCKVKR